MKAIQTKNYNLGKLLKPHANQWVALSNDRKRVLASGNTLKEVANKTSGRDVVLMKAFPSDAFYAPYAV
ncbi:MAG: DUF5678 domain-containing protein [bacterium]|nr:DUF5678 domain-containing protein [bacterium]